MAVGGDESHPTFGQWSRAEEHVTDRQPGSTLGDASLRLDQIVAQLMRQRAAGRTRIVYLIPAQIPNRAAAIGAKKSGVPPTAKWVKMGDLDSLCDGRSVGRKYVLPDAAHRTFMPVRLQIKSIFLQFKAHSRQMSTVNSTLSALL